MDEYFLTLHLNNVVYFWEKKDFLQSECSMIDVISPVRKIKFEIEN
jgi:hypothetical protein